MRVVQGNVTMQHQSGIIIIPSCLSYSLTANYYENTQLPLNSFPCPITEVEKTMQKLNESNSEK